MSTSSKEEQVIIGPASPFQEKYLNSDAQIILVGGKLCAAFKPL